MFEYRENLITDNALRLVWKEIEIIYPLLFGPEQTGTSRSNIGLLKKGKGFLCSEDMSKNIIPTCHKVAKVVGEKLDYKKLDILINYYEDGDYYKPHSDDASKTMIIPLCKYESKFTGGSFKFTDLNITLPFINNNSILFDGKMRHEVTEINMINNGNMLGRFSLNFFYF